MPFWLISCRILILRQDHPDQNLLFLPSLEEHYRLEFHQALWQLFSSP